MVQPDGRIVQPNLKPELLLATPDIPKYAYHSDSNSQLLPVYQKESGEKIVQHATLGRITSHF